MRAAARAYDTVRDAILLGKYQAGSRLIEEELARTIGVSRTPIREALRRLHAEGLIQFEPNHGAVVAIFDTKDAEERFELRAVLEPIGASRAAERASAAVITELRSLAELQVAETMRLGSESLARITGLNDQFHGLIQRAAASAPLSRAMSGLVEAPLVVRTFSQYTQAELRRSADQHLELVQAIEARDPSWARSVMHTHILSGRATYFRWRNAASVPPRVRAAI
jgi:DNA-binding GntR family transcriptional regulator